MIPRRERVMEMLLGALDDPWFLTVTRNDLRALDPAALPALVVLDGGEEVDELDPVTKRVRLRVEVIGVGRAATAAELGPLMSDMRARILVMVTRDRTLRGAVSMVAHTATSDPVISEADGQPPEAAIGVTLVLDYFEAAADPWA